MDSILDDAVATAAMDAPTPDDHDHDHDHDTPKPTMDAPFPPPATPPSPSLRTTTTDTASTAAEAARSEPFWTRTSNKSLESFAIATTPFHEPDADDGEYYMDEAGNWLHRWATTTEVKAVKAGLVASTGHKASRRLRHEKEETEGDSAEPDADAAADSGWEESPTKTHGAGQDSPSTDDSSPDTSAVIESSSSSEGAAIERHRRWSDRPRPRLDRRSRSSFLPSEYANHASPERADIRREPKTPWEERGDPVRELAAQRAGSEPTSDEEAETRQAGSPPVDPECPTEETRPPATLIKALSCPSSPRQPPLRAAAQLSSPPSPELHRTRTQDLEPVPDLDGPPQRPQLRASGTSSGRSSVRRSSKAWSHTIPLHRAKTEDAYLAHQRAVALFSPPLPPGPEKETSRPPSVVRPPVQAPRTISAAAFLASKPDSMPLPTRTEQASEGSQAPSGSQKRRSSTFSRDASSDAIRVQGDDASAGGRPPEAPSVPVLTDHRMTLDWTHPETRARADRKRRGFVGKVRRMLSRSRSHQRGSAEEDLDDRGSVRRVRVEMGKERTGNGRDDSVAEGIAERRKGWSCFG